MLPSFKGFEIKGFSISLTAYPGDVELNVGSFGITLMWGDAPMTGLFIRTATGERHLEWPWNVGRQLTNGRELSPGR